MYMYIFVSTLYMYLIHCNGGFVLQLIFGAVALATCIYVHDCTCTPNYNESAYNLCIVISGLTSCRSVIM